MGRAIPKHPPPAAATSVQVTLRALSALFTRVGARDTDTTVFDMVQPSPVLASGVSVSTPASGYIGYAPWIGSVGRAECSVMDKLLYNFVVACPPAEVCTAVSAPPHDIGYYLQSRWCPPTTTYTPPVVTVREQAPGTSAPSTNTCSDTTGPCNNQLAQLIRVLQEPKVTIPTFNSNPMSYQHFIRAFEDNVKWVISDNATRLAWLSQQCTSEAARVIECCMLMPPELGYPRARELLRSRFGDEIIIVDLWVRRLVGQTKTLPLQEYADNLCSCYETLTTMNALIHLDNSTNLPKLVDQLPGYLQSRWRSLALKLRKERLPRWSVLLDLVEFTEDTALDSNDPLYVSKGNMLVQPPTMRGSRLVITNAPMDSMDMDGDSDSDISSYLDNSATDTAKDTQMAQSYAMCYSMHVATKCHVLRRLGSSDRLAKLRGLN